jgi:hypothetical protein
MRPGLDNSPPRRYPHLVLRLKQTQVSFNLFSEVSTSSKTNKQLLFAANLQDAKAFSFIQFVSCELS